MKPQIAIEKETPPEPDRHALAPHPRETPDLFGQERAEASFLDAVRTGRLHHAWLVTGPRGIGKATLCWRIARYLLAGGDGESLSLSPAHPISRQVQALSAPGLALCRRPWDAKANRFRKEITVEEARAIKANLQLSAPDASWRVAIIDAVDDMNKGAANALLKVLEEPPANTIMLLVSHRPSRLLPTIRSRCRELKCTPLSAENLARALAQAGHPQNPDDARALAALTGGSVVEALDLTAGDGVALYARIATLIGSRSPMDRVEALSLAETCNGQDKAEKFPVLLRLLERALCRLALSGVQGDLTPVSEAEASMIARFGVTEAQARLWADLTATITTRAEMAYAVNLDPVHVILDTLLQIDAAAVEASRLAA
ncbi:DNA polymerase III subunit delta' [Amaricoccus macauensis]|uniref:DNA polymerase III subunit delta' n=1 Tax=Amaricoccus macauensis TaxID=57001 RepID=UPI003C7DBFB3